MRRIEKARGRVALLAVSLTLVCFVHSGCGDQKLGTSTRGEEPRLPSAEADIHGVITEVGRMPQQTNGGGSAGKRVGVVLVEETPTKIRGLRKIA